MRSSARFVVAVCALAACNSAVEEETRRAAARAITAQPVVAKQVEKPPVGVPHGGFITTVALTEAGDAAVSIDNVGGSRLWPTLDGSREPIPFAVAGADRLAITALGTDELLVGVLDEAGAVHLLRFSRGGVLRGTIQVPGESAVTQLVAIEHGMLVMRDDQSIERFDASGVRRGRLVADPGEAFGSIAVRHGAAAVLIAARRVDEGLPIEALQSAGPGRHRKPLPPAPLVTTRTAAALRWIELGDGLRWGTTVKLPADLLPDQLALSPSHRRIGVVTTIGAQLVVYDVEASPPVLVEAATPNVPKVNDPNAPVGFVDDDHALQLAGRTLWWVAKHAPKAEPNWKAFHIDTSGTQSITSTGGGFGDGLVVAGFGPDLLLQDLHDTRYLGWSDVALGLVVAMGDRVAIQPTNSRIVFLDRQLHRDHELELSDLGYGTPDGVWWLDADHAVLRSPDPIGAKIELVDLRKPKVRVVLGRYSYMQRAEWQPELGTVAIIVDSEIRRFSLDLDKDTATELPVMLSASPQLVRMFDPAVANGVFAIVTAYTDDGLGTYVFKTTDRMTPSKGQRGKRQKRLDGGVLGMSAAGVLYAHDDAGIYTVRDGKQQLRFPKDEVSELIVPDRTGTRLASLHGAAIAMLDPTGKPLWRRTLWAAQGIVFSGDGTQLIVRTSGGLVALDAATGERTATACGFTFGIMTKTPQANALNTQPVCEDLGT